MKLPQLWRLFSLCPETLVAALSHHLARLALVLVLATISLAPPAPSQTSFAYVVNNFETTDSSDSAVWMYRVDRSTGALTPNGSIPFGVGVSPLQLATDPLNKFLYIANSYSISAFAIDPTSGILSPLPGAPYGAWEVAVHPSGKFLYAARGFSGVALYTLDATGVPTFVSQTADVSGAATALTIDPSGKFLYTANLLANTASFYTIDKNSGALTLAAQVPTGPSQDSVATGFNALSIVVTK